MKKDKIYVAGHNGMAGSAMVRRIRSAQYENIVTRSHSELDLTNQTATRDFFESEHPDVVVLAAARVGGIHANSVYPADFILNNLQIQTNVIEAAWRNGVRKLMFLGSACIYPKLATQPMAETALLTGPLEPTNEWYAVAKIAGISLCDALRRQHGFNSVSIMPNNLYGPGDNFHLENAHVLPALIRKFHEAKVAGAAEVVVWGTGKPFREFLHVDDFADAAVFLLDNYDDGGIVNVGTGSDISIADAALLIKQVVGYEGDVIFDDSKPDGMPKKLLDCSKLRELGWRSSIVFRDGLAATYEWFVNNQDTFRRS
ncbi:MAG: GDP-L-fucose synthase [Rhodospirillales bacterium]|nr:GDP-L-fucose synthase [Rhodospirillales bacterium]